MSLVEPTNRGETEKNLAMKSMKNKNLSSAEWRKEAKNAIERTSSTEPASPNGFK